MKTIKFISQIIVTTTLSFTFTYCGNNTDNNPEVLQQNNTTENNDTINIIDTTTIQNSETTPSEKSKNSTHQHAAYVCPMGCEGGESNQPGTCPTCGMELVKFETLKNQHETPNNK